MAEYFHIPPEDGWEENTYYVCEVSIDYGNLVFEAILYSGFLIMSREYREFSGVFNALMDQKFRPLNYFKYINL